VDSTIRIEIDGAVLKTAIDQVVFAAAPDDTRPVLAGVLLRLDTGSVRWPLPMASGSRSVPCR
jgi:DNA polymerase III sliding clamp (beta) subunit (PCNA family)